MHRMKRPLAVVGFAYLFSLLAANFLSINLCAVASLLLLTAAPLVFFLKVIPNRQMVAAVLLTTSIACFVHLMTTLTQVYPAEALDGRSGYMSATVLERGFSSNGRLMHTVRVDHLDIEGAPTGFLMQVYAMDRWEFDYDDRVAMKVEWMAVPESARLQARAEGVYLYGMIGEVTEILPAERPSLRASLYQLRDGLMRQVRLLLPDYQGELLGAIALGDDTGIPESVSFDFQGSGLAHILAVSGLHVSAFAMLIFRGLCSIQAGRYGIGRRTAAAFSLTGIVLYIILTGASPSAVRAGVMTGIYYLGIVLRRDADPFNSMGLAALLLTVPAPFAAADVGLLLSFASTLGILLFAGRLQSQLESRLAVDSRPARAILGAFSVTLSANLATLPITMLAFGRVSLVAPLANLLISPLLPLLLPISMLTAIAASIPFLHYLAVGCGFVAGMLLSILCQVAGIFAALPFAQVGASAGYLTIWIFGALVLIAVAVAMRERRLVRTAALLCVVTLLTGVLSHNIFMRDVLAVTLVDEDGGSHAILSLGDRSMVVGGGRKPFFGRLVARTMQGMGKERADLLLFPMLDRKHGAGAIRLLGEMDADFMILPGSRTKNEDIVAAAGGVDQIIALGDMVLDCWGGETTIRTFSEGAAVHLSVGEAKILLLTGKVDMAKLPPSLCHCSLLILEEELPDHHEMIRAERAILCSDEMRATLTLKLTALGTEVLNPRNGGSGMTVLFRTNSGACAVVR